MLSCRAAHRSWVAEPRSACRRRPDAVPPSWAESPTTSGRLLEAVLHRHQAEERLAAGSAWSDSDGLVFVSKWGEPLYPDTVTALMTKLINSHNKALTEADQRLPHARLHDLRHLHATTLLLAGVPVHVVAARLGHADPSVTLRVYSHVLREHAQGIGDVFAQAIKTSVSGPVSNGRNEN